MGIVRADLGMSQALVHALDDADFIQSLSIPESF